MCAIALLCATPAFAETLDHLATNYQLATINYENALVEQEHNAQEITEVEGQIHETEIEFEESKELLGNSAVAMYKHERNRSDMLSLLLESESLTDAIVRCESYARIENNWIQTVERVKQKRAQLGVKKDQLEEERELIADKVEDSMNAVNLAALYDADHSDGALYHQRQGNGSNCGATSFTVGLNILLHEQRFPDNVAVWNGPGFHGDSTHSLDFKGATWLMAKGLSDQITCEAVPGDIHFADQLKAELEQGKVVIISAGPGSEWQRADGTKTDTGVFPDGHWIVFYYYKDGVFYCNDSSVKASKGAGCAYTTAQMQAWLNGRGNHFATTLTKKHFGQPVPPTKAETVVLAGEKTAAPSDEGAIGAAAEETAEAAAERASEGTAVNARAEAADREGAEATVDEDED